MRSMLSRSGGESGSSGEPGLNGEYCFLLTIKITGFGIISYSIGQFLDLIEIYVGKLIRGVPEWKFKSDWNW